MKAEPIPRAVLLDCLGTLLELEPPAPRLAGRLGVARDDAERAMRAEIAFYRAHMHEARDAASLARLRERCAALVGEQLGVDCGVADLLGALVFRPFGEVREVLAALRARGTRLVIVSNWDVSLHEVVGCADLTPLVDGVVSSAEVGAAKPDPAPVRAGLEIAGVGAHEALMVGDSPEDVEAARAAGVAALRLDRPRVTLRALL